VIYGYIGGDMADPAFGSEMDLSGLKQQLSQREAELAVINSVQQGLASKLDFKAILNLVGNKIGEVFGALFVYIALYDRGTDQIEFPYIFNFVIMQHYSEGPRPLSTGFSAHMIRTRQPILIKGDYEQKMAEFGSSFFTGQNLTPEQYPKSFLGVPMLSGEDVVGTVTLVSDQENAFSDTDLRLLQTLANAMSIALENARLFDEVQKRNQEISEALEQQTATSNVLRVIAESPMDVQPVLDVVAEYGALLSTTVECAIFLVVGESEIRLAAQAGPDRVYPLGAQFPLNHESIAGSAILDKTICHVPNIEETGDRFPLSKSVQIKYRAFLGVPLMRESQCIGAIFIRRPEALPFSEKQINLVRTFADQAVIAIENVRLFNETQRLLKETEDRNAELQIINSVQEGLAKKLEMDGIYELVGEKLREIFQYADLSIGVYVPETDLLSVPFIIESGRRLAFEPIKLNGKGFVGYLLQHPKSLLINENMGQAVIKYQSVDITGTGLPKSALYVPLMMGGSMRGSVVLEDMQKEHAFSESDVRLLETLASSMSIALENARLWEQEKLYRKALEREFEIGREIQAGFLPDFLPQPKGWEIAASLKSAREVAGDFYDVFELPDEKIGLVIADVCDKGLGAALFMTLFRSLLRAGSNIDFFAPAKSEDEDSSALRLKNAISLTNNYIAETHGNTGMFATIFFGILDSHAGVLTYVNGGHLPPLLVNKGRIRNVLGFTGPAVGVIPDVEYGIKETVLKPDDLFFAFTDGLTDAVNPSGEFFSEKDFIPFLKKDLPLAKVLAQIESRVEKHAASAKQFDDITMLAVRRLRTEKKSD
jgi:serine phosphatase RsbU (regulator of sigma subunit)